MHMLESRLEHQVPGRTANGSLVSREFSMCSDAMVYGARYLDNQWVRKTSASSRHLGIWVNWNELKMRIFCEGDVAELQAVDRRALEDELDEHLEHARTHG